MIVDDLKNLPRYRGMNPYLDQAIDYLLANKVQQYDLGKYEIDQDRVFLFIQENQLASQESEIFEYHKTYADVHFLIDGFETVYYGVGQERELSPFDDATDYGASSCKMRYPFQLGYHNFAIFLPGEYHQPNQSAGKGSTVRKCVIKFLVEG